MVTIGDYGSQRPGRPHERDADCIIARRDIEPAPALSAMEREVLRDLVMATAGFVLIIAAVILGLSA